MSSHTRLEHGNVRREVCAPCFSRDRGAEELGRQRTGSTGAERSRAMLTGSYVPCECRAGKLERGGPACLALLHKIKPRRVCTPKGDFIQLPLPDFHLLPPARCRRNPREYMGFLKGTLFDFCLPGSLRDCGWLHGDGEQRDKWGRAAGIAPGTAGVWRGGIDAEGVSAWSLS